MELMGDGKIEKLTFEPLDYSQKLPGAIGTMADLFYLYEGGYSDGGWLQNIGIDVVVEYSPQFSQIKEDYPNNVFSIGNDAIIGVYDLSCVPENRVSTAKSQILLQEIQRLQSLDKRGLYDENVVIEIVEQEFPMSYSEGGIVSTSTHVVVVKNYKRCLGIECDETEVDEPTGKKIQECGRSKGLGSWLKKLIEKKN